MLDVLLKTRDSKFYSWNHFISSHWKVYRNVTCKEDLIKFHLVYLLTWDKVKDIVNRQSKEYYVNKLTPIISEYAEEKLSESLSLEGASIRLIYIPMKVIR